MAIVPDPSPTEVARMMARHRAQLEELLTNYGRIDMLSLDNWLGPAVWPQMRTTLLRLRQIQPDVMLRARGIGNYGDYYTPEGFVPGNKENTDMPWMVIYPLAGAFSYDPDQQHYKGAAWIVRNLVDAVAKGGSLQVGVGPDRDGKFHPAAIAQFKEAGAWLRVNGEGIYATRARPGNLWSEGESVRFSATKDGRFLYVFVLAWPGRELALQTVKATTNTRVTMLGVADALAYRNEPERGLVIRIPEELQDPAKRPCAYAWAFRMEGVDAG
jgi:alpha-L-fucosidase